MRAVLKADLHSQSSRHTQILELSHLDRTSGPYTRLELNLCKLLTRRACNALKIQNSGEFSGILSTFNSFIFRTESESDVIAGAKEGVWVLAIAQIVASA